MSVLIDKDILWLLQDHGAIRPWTTERVQPASYDLSLGPIMKRWHKDQWMEFSITENGYSLPKNELLLFTTQEYVMLPPGIAGRIEGKSSIARKGVFIHVTAGWIDPGFQGEITLEFLHVGPTDVRVWAGMPVCQIAFFQCSGEASKPYGSDGLGSHYQGQRGATESRA